MLTLTARVDVNIEQPMVQLLVDGLPGRLQAACEDALVKVGPEMVRRLRTYPGSVKYPIAWTSERQRRAYFATNGFGAGIPYRRTGGLAAGWSVSGARRAAGYVVSVEGAEVGRFVVGSLRDVVVGRQRYQQRYHIHTGWMTAADVVADGFEAFASSLGEALARGGKA